MQDQAILSELKHRYYTIGEVAEICDLKPHVLRYWEKEFKALSPSKRRGNRRYYRKDDIQVVFAIKTLLYREGYTIAGARLRLLEVLKAAPAETGAGEAAFNGDWATQQSSPVSLTVEPAESLAHPTDLAEVSPQYVAEVRRELQELLAFMRGGEQYRREA